MLGMELYRRLLALLPGDFRREYAEEMEQVVADHRRALREQPLGRLRFWARQYLGVTTLALRLRLVGDGGRGAGQDSTGTHGHGKRERWTMMGMGQDLRHALRGLVKQPGFTLVTVITLGLGIGASTAIFSAVHSVLFRDLPYGDADRIVAVFHEDRETAERSTGASAANMRDLSEMSDLLVHAAAADPWSLDLVLDDRTETLRTWSVARGFFRTLSPTMHLGRVFTEQEYDAGNEKVIILGHGSWVNRFGADPRIVGRTLTFAEESYTVVGVLPPDFKYPDAAEAWIPRPAQPWDGSSRAADYLSAVARLAPGVSLEAAQAEVDRIALSLSETYPQTNATTGLRLVSLREHLLGNVQTPLMVLMGAVGLVLLIACANVAGLMLARGARREREYALRGALGAGRWRIARLIATESLLLAGLGCALGIGLTVFGVRAIGALGPDHLPRIDELSVDGMVLLFAVAASAASAVLAGLAPAFRLSRPELHETLSDGSRGSTGGPGANRVRDRLVVLEVGAALVLLIGAGLLGKSFTILVNEDLGFDPENRLALQVFAYDYGPGEFLPFVNGVLENLGALPGVTGVAITTSVPSATDGAIADIDIDLPFRVEGRTPPPAGREPVGWTIHVTAGYFDVMDIPISEGRGFTEEDRSDAPPVAMVNETFARRHLGGTAVGERIELPLGQQGWVMREIVGVVRDVRPSGFESQPRPEIYFPLTQVGSGSLTFVARAENSAGLLTQPAMEAVWEVNPAQAIWGSTTVEALLAERLKERRFNLLLLGSFAVIALILAAIGIYGLISFSVEQRIGELGIRRALGGQNGDVLRMVLREGTSLAATGVVMGLLAALVLTRLLRGMLFGVEVIDGQTFTVLALAVLAVSALATLIPAWRATRVDPIEALRGN